MQQNENESRRLAIRALAHRWEVPPEDRPKLMQTVLGMVLDPKASRRQKVSAYKAILAAEALDLRAVEVGMRADEHDAILARLEALEADVADGSSDQTG